MKFNCGKSKRTRSSESKIQALAEAEEMRNWHPWFAWFPVRVGESDCRWMEPVKRRYSHVSVIHDHCFNPWRFWQVEYWGINYREVI